MKAEIDIDGVRYRTNFSQAIDLSTPIAFDNQGWDVDQDIGHDDSEQMRPPAHTAAFGLPLPASTPVAGDGFCLDTQKGGAVNCCTLTLTPHGNGTHTESVSHIVDESVSVAWASPQGLVPAAVLTVPSVKLGQTDEHYGGKHEPHDDVVTASALLLARRIASMPDAFLHATIIRTGAQKPAAGQWTGTNPPYLTEEATKLLRTWGCEHLLLDVPSIDREDDGGATICHHIFWSVPPGHRLAGKAPRRTITEMARLPPDLVDGTYLLDLQVPPLLTDAAPSRPFLFRAELA